MNTTTITRILILLLLTVTNYSYAQTRQMPEDSFFYQASVKKYTLTVEEPNSSKDQTTQLQKAIDNVAKKGGGTLIIKGSADNFTYNLNTVQLKSNVHVRVASNVVFKPLKQLPCIFSIGLKAPERLHNISFTGIDNEKFTFDFTAMNIEERMRAFSIGAVSNYRIADILIKDNFTKFPTMNFVPSRAVDTDGSTIYLYPIKGIVENISQETSQYGYGILQVQAAKFLLARNLECEGGVTLRLETDVIGEAHVNDPTVRLDSIYGRNIKCVNGQSALTLSPHTVHNGYIDVDKVTTISCEVGAVIAAGFFGKHKKDKNGNVLPGYKLGFFDSNSIISNMNVEYGTTAQLRNGRIKFVPCDQKKLLARSKERKEIYNGPSIGLIFYNANEGTSNEEGYYTIRTDNLTSSGFSDSNLKFITSNNQMFKCKK